MSTAFKDAPTETIDVGGTRFAYRRLGVDAGVPVRTTLPGPYDELIF